MLSIQALQSPRLESADFVLLSLAVISQKLRPGPEALAMLEAIEDDFVFNKNDRASAGVLHLLSHCAGSASYHEIAPIIQAAHDRVLDQPEKNQTRRYFESTLSKAIAGAISPEQIAILAKFNTVIVTISGEAHAPEEAITVDEVFTAMRTLGEDRPEIERVIKAIGRESSKYQAKDRGWKKTEISSSCTHGIMRSTDPLPRDEYLDAPRAGRVVDSFAIKPGPPEAGGFSRQRPSTPFVNSISGTAFTFVHFLLAFIHENTHDSNLQMYIDNLTLMYIASTIHNGYHSLDEVSQVFSEPAIAKILAPHHVTINVTFDKALLRSSIDAATKYSEVLCLRRSALADLHSHHIPRGTFHEYHVGGGAMAHDEALGPRS